VNFLDERLPARFWDKCTPEPNSGCWLWFAAGDRYGRIGDHAAHRVAYQALVGPIPVGLELDHRVCQTPRCCNPSHLEAVTHRENVRRGRMSEVNSARQRNKTHCPRGHAYDKANTIRKPDNRRQCRACSRESVGIINRRIRIARGLKRTRKLRPEDVLVIRRRFNAGERARLISMDFNCSEHTIHDIATGRSWAHLKEK
jgi:hypothetical protein